MLLALADGEWGAIIRRRNVGARDMPCWTDDRSQHKAAFSLAAANVKEPVGPLCYAPSLAKRQSMHELGYNGF